MYRYQYLVLFLVSIILLLSASISIASEDDAKDRSYPRDQTGHPGSEKKSEMKSEFPKNDDNIDDVTITNDEEKNDDFAKEDETSKYEQGSVCVYCQYCKFCKLCDKDCPCKAPEKKPYCHMCKYCSYCNLCTNVCDNFCKPGSFLDTISSAIFKALPKFDTKTKNEIDKDIESVKEWIKSYM